MNELIKISQTEINNEKVNSVNARELHKVLEVKTEFAKWIKRRIEETMSEEDVDFIVVKNDDTGNALFKAVEYIISIDLAKEISMLERNQKGKEIRKYFIECEKQLKQLSQPQFSLPQTYKEALLELVKVEEEKERLLIENKQQEETIEEQNVIIDGYDECSKARRSKQELKSKFHELVRLYSYKTGIKYNLIYNDVYANFKSLHNFKYGTKIDISFLEKNIDYLVECVEIISSMINNLKQTKR